MVSKFGNSNGGNQPTLDLVTDFLTPGRKVILEEIEEQSDDAKAELDLRPVFEEAVEEHPDACPLRDFETTLEILQEWGLIEDAGSWSSAEHRDPQQTYDLTKRGTELFDVRGTIQTTAIPADDRDPGDWARNPVSPHLLSAELVSYVDSAVDSAVEDE